MGYRLRPGAPIDREVRRIASRQIELALAALRATDGRSDDESIHRARRHLKKLRALIALVRAPLGAGVRHSAIRHFKEASRLLAALADADAVVDTLDHLQTIQADLPVSVFDTLRAGLEERKADAARVARRKRVKDRVRRLLRAEHRAVRGWRLSDSRFRMVAPGLERTVRRSRRAMATALVRPTSASFHAWRQRVKDLWLQVRLVQRLTGGTLQEFEQHVEALDGCLGEIHNCSLLRDILIRSELVSRPRTAACLRLIRSYERALRETARDRGAGVHAEGPRAFVRRVRRLRRQTQDQLRERESRAWRNVA